jgi:hypothetical protein
MSKHYSIEELRDMMADLILSQKETDKKFQDTDKKFKETDKTVKKLAGLFTTQCGKLVEALVEPSCIKIFRERGVLIEQSFQNVKAKHEERDMEIDVLLVNDTELVVVEVKTTCRPGYIEDLKDKLVDFKLFFPQYKNYDVYGAIAAIKFESSTDKLAYKSGLFVIKASGDGFMRITNDQKFKPKAF